MQASSPLNRLKKGMAVTDWLWWRLPLGLRAYVGVVPAVAVAVIAVAAIRTEWHAYDAVKFLILVVCGVISVASTPRIMYDFPGLTKDFSSIWVLPTAILLPPLYAALMPIFMSTALNLFVHRGVLHRAVFTAGATSLGYAAASLVFRCFPASFAGSAVGAGTHAFTWCVAVVVCEIIGSRGHHFLILGAIKMSAPDVHIMSMELDRESLQALFVEIDLGVLITLAVALSPALVFIAVPTVLLVRRFLIFPVLEAQSRMDSKTGLLNVSTWEKEAESELSRSIRTRNPVALALVDIDHFKAVNDTYGHLVGDRVLKAIAEALTGQSRDYDRAGRFGGEEFVLLLAQTNATDACKIAERLRGYIANMAVPVDDRPDAPTLGVTISVGVTALARGESYELTDLLAAADSAMYVAKEAGRNQVAFAQPLHDMGLDTLDAAPGADSEPGQTRDGVRRVAGALSSGPLSSHRVELVQAEPSAASLCPRR